MTNEQIIAAFRDTMGQETLSDNAKLFDFAGSVLIALAIEAGSDKSTLTKDRCTFKGKEVGNWRILVEKVD